MLWKLWIVQPVYVVIMFVVDSWAHGAGGIRAIFPFLLNNNAGRLHIALLLISFLPLLYYVFNVFKNPRLVLGINKIFKIPVLMFLKVFKISIGYWLLAAVISLYWLALTQNMISMQVNFGIAVCMETAPWVERYMPRDMFEERFADTTRVYSPDNRWLHPDYMASWSICRQYIDPTSLIRQGEDMGAFDQPWFGFLVLPIMIIFYVIAPIRIIFFVVNFDRNLAYVKNFFQERRTK